MSAPPWEPVAEELGLRGAGELDAVGFGVGSFDFEAGEGGVSLGCPGFRGDIEIVQRFWVVGVGEIW